VTLAPATLTSDLDAIARAADHLYDGLEASGFNLQAVPEEVLMSLSAPDLGSAFERATFYLRERCEIDIWAVLSTV
jgi:hypothetical protein